MIHWAVLLWVCMASAVIRAPSRSRGASSSGRAGISLDLSDTLRCPTTTPLARPGAARRWGAGLSPVRAPRMVLPSTAITLRPPMAPTRVRSQDDTLASRSSAFTRSSTLRMVDSLGRARPSSRSRSPRSSGPRSATCSRIASSVRHPARTPTTDRHRIAVRQWRTPRLSRGSVTPFRTSFRGWRDRAVVVDDGMAARPPGGEVDSSTAHRPGGAAPHPRQHADNPGHQTTPTDFAETLITRHMGSAGPVPQRR